MTTETALAMKMCKHKYRPRYDRQWSTLIKDMAENPSEITIKGVGNGSYLKSSKYIHDICVRCGDIKKA